MKEWTETEENTELLFEFYEGVIYNVLQRINLTKKILLLMILYKKEESY